jgi:hypothetical protein
MLTQTRLILLGMLIVPLAGCGTEPICTDEIVPGVVVEIRDAFDDVPLAANARGAVHQGTFVDSLRPHGSVGDGTLISRAAADERPGEYLIRVEHVSYLTWEDVVLVRANECHVETVLVSAYLSRVS